MTNGGIELNARKMGLEVGRDGGGVKMTVDSAMVAEFQKGNFTGAERRCAGLPRPGAITLF